MYSGENIKTFGQINLNQEYVDSVEQLYSLGIFAESEEFFTVDDEMLT